MLSIFKHEILYITYTDDTTFFLKDKIYILELKNELNTSSNFSGLKPNMTKCEITGIDVLNGVQVGLLSKINIFQNILSKENAF